MEQTKTNFGLRKGHVLTDDELLALAGMEPRLAAAEETGRDFVADALDAAGQAAWMCLIGVAFVLGFAGGLALI